MKNVLFLLFLSYFCSFAWSQSIGYKTEVTIQNTFDNITIQTYANQAEMKVEELVEYLKMAQNPDNSTAFNAQLESTIQQLFITEEPIQLLGIESKVPWTDSKQWLVDWKQSKVTIVSLELIDSELKDSYWNYNYQLVCQVNGKKIRKKMTVQVYFKQRSKSFGKTQRHVWDLKIGSVTFSK